MTLFGRRTDERGRQHAEPSGTLPRRPARDFRSEHDQIVRDAEWMRKLGAFDMAGNRIAIARAGDSFYAFADTCTHQGCSLADGELEGTTVTCPCHGSQFNVTTGDVLRGPAREPVRSYPVRVEDNALQVEL
jgi:nitrite reductase/ring-hydroxylating ferredoxin subunit